MITMQKCLLVVLIIALIGFSVIYYFPRGALKIDPNDQICQEDTDCVRAMVKCSCDCGVPINKLSWQKYLARQEKMCKFYFGRMCKIGCNEVPKCINNICTIS